MPCFDSRCDCMASIFLSRHIFPLRRWRRMMKSCFTMERIWCAVCGLLPAMYRDPRRIAVVHSLLLRRRMDGFKFDVPKGVERL